METIVELKLPETIAFDSDMLQRLTDCNPGLSLQIENAIIRIKEKGLHFSEMDFFALHFPFKLSEEIIDHIGRLNEERRVEFNEESIIINMSALEFISVFTAAVAGTLYIWNKKRKMGRIMDSQGEHNLTINGKNIRRMPDVAFHLYESFAGKVYNKTSRAGAPFLCIEVVSNKNSLNQDLQKMEQDWMAGGVQIGLVVCPFREQYFQFEQGKSSYQSFSFTTPFAYSLLPDLSLDFAALLQEAIQEIEK